MEREYNVILITEMVKLTREHLKFNDVRNITMKLKMLTKYATYTKIKRVYQVRK